MTSPRVPEAERCASPQVKPGLYQMTVPLRQSIWSKNQRKRANKTGTAGLYRQGNWGMEREGPVTPKSGILLPGHPQGPGVEEAADGAGGGFRPRAHLMASEAVRENKKDTHRRVELPPRIRRGLTAQGRSDWGAKSSQQQEEPGSQSVLH